MNVKINQAQVLEACQEWVLKHYGLKVSGDTAVVECTDDQDDAFDVEDLTVEFLSVTKPETPYRG